MPPLPHHSQLQIHIEALRRAWMGLAQPEQRFGFRRSTMRL